MVKEIVAMVSATHSRHFGVHANRAVPDRSRTMLKRLARHLTDVLEQRRQRELDEVVARLLSQSGGRFSDSLEAEIARKFLGSGWNLPL